MQGYGSAGRAIKLQETIADRQTGLETTVQSRIRIVNKRAINFYCNNKSVGEGKSRVLSRKLFIDTKGIIVLCLSL